TAKIPNVKIASVISTSNLHASTQPPHLVEIVGATLSYQFLGNPSDVTPFGIPSHLQYPTTSCIACC
ncbi:hypothetical protein, partial [Streptococcus suis]|uniref:hypothetical protein n=1 Tax=Streptococcus suis TaxID=1307 RepID=UPI001E55527B